MSFGSAALACYICCEDVLEKVLQLSCARLLGTSAAVSRDWRAIVDSSTAWRNAVFALHPATDAARARDEFWDPHTELTPTEWRRLGSEMTTRKCSCCGMYMDVHYMQMAVACEKLAAALAVARGLSFQRRAKVQRLRDLLGLRPHKFGLLRRDSADIGNQTDGSQQSIDARDANLVHGPLRETSSTRSPLGNSVCLEEMLIFRDHAAEHPVDRVEQMLQISIKGLYAEDAAESTVDAGVPSEAPEPVRRDLSPQEFFASLIAESRAKRSLTLSVTEVRIRWVADVCSASYAEDAGIGWTGAWQLHFAKSVADGKMALDSELLLVRFVSEAATIVLGSWCELHECHKSPATSSGRSGVGMGEIGRREGGTTPAGSQADVALADMYPFGHDGFRLSGSDEVRSLLASPEAFRDVYLVRLDTLASIAARRQGHFRPDDEGRSPPDLEEVLLRHREIINAGFNAFHATLRRACQAVAPELLR